MIRALTFRTGRPAESTTARPADVNERFFPPASRLPAWYVRLIKSVRKLGQRVRGFIGLRRGVRVGGLWYKELAAIPMHRALRQPPRGPGFKDFRVTFPSGDKLIIRCTEREVYADLMGSVGLDRLYLIADLIRPGTRVLELGAGSGYRAAWLSSLVGPSGSVVAIGMSREPIDYATRRYQLPNVAFEVASPQSLAGETDGSFDVAVITEMLADDRAGNAALEDIWRVLVPGGLLVINAEQPTTPVGPDKPRGPAYSSAATHMQERLTAIHRKLAEPGTAPGDPVPEPRVVARTPVRRSLPAGQIATELMMLAVFKPGGASPG